MLITGGAGFVGSHLADVLVDAGHQVTVLDDLSTGRLENLDHLRGRPNLAVVVEEMTNDVVLDRLASESDVIFHLGASVGVKLIVDNPVRTVENNVLGTEAVLRAALRYRAKVLLASTSEVYGKGVRVPFREEDDVVLGPTSQSRWGYAASKMVDEVLTIAHHREKGLPVVVFRLFNTVGPRQTGRYGMVVPRFVEAALRGRPLEVYGDGGQSRCFIHVADAVDAIVRLAECPQAEGKVFNIGHTDEVSILELASRVRSAVSPVESPGEVIGRGPFGDRPRRRWSTGDGGARGAPIVFVPYERAYGPGFEDMRRRVPDISRIRAATGWEPRRTLDDVIADVAEDLRRRLVPPRTRSLPGARLVPRAPGRVAAVEPLVPPGVPVP